MIKASVNVFPWFLSVFRWRSALFLEALNPSDKARLMAHAAGALKPQLAALPAADVIKLVLALAGEGGDLLEAAAEEAIERRTAEHPPSNGVERERDHHHNIHYIRDELSLE